ncbi:hippurate hydrolase [Rhizobiales bacterium GAS188]|nr:hippurate hydrolase [Rhizobiales bacterium GAS188]
MDNQDLLSEIEPYRAELTEIRRDIHAHPETAFEEQRTAAIVAEKLRGWGIEVEEGVGKTGVVGTIVGNGAGQRAIALRADMDALNIIEQNDFAHISQNAGKMHACGHDGHTTMLLGAARYLAEHRDFGGTVHLIFQPAEEGMGGARTMIAEGLFDRFPCDVVYGMHNMPGIPAGQFAIRPGAMMAAGDRWEVTFKGTGGHGGMTPHLSTDVTVVQAHFVLALQTIVGRNIAAVEPAVISVGYIGGGARRSANVMPAEIVVSGTSRSYSEATRDIIERRMRELATTLATAHGCSAAVDFHRLGKALVNHAEQTEVAIKAAASIVGTAKVDGNTKPITAGEDFTEMLLRKPGAFIFIGNGVDAEGGAHGLHTPKFEFNDDIITLGASYWVSLVREELATA